jgi:hypothetical protein
MTTKLTICSHLLAASPLAKAAGKDTWFSR